MAQDADKLAAQSERLRELKKLSRDITYKSISDAINVTERQIQRWFAGESEVNGSNLKALAKYLGTTPDYIEYGVIKRQRPDAAATDQRSQPDLMFQLDEINAKLTRLQAIVERLAGEKLVAAALQELEQTGRPAPSKHPRRAA